MVTGLRYMDVVNNIEKVGSVLGVKWTNFKFVSALVGQSKLHLLHLNFISKYATD